MPAEIRTARASDVDDLVAHREGRFSSDRISRRSFRQLIERETAEMLVAEKDGRVAGYAMVLFRKGSGVARLYSIAIGPVLRRARASAACCWQAPRALPSSTAA